MHASKPLVTRAIANIDTRAATIATGILWSGALGWYIYRAFPRLPHADVSTYDFGETLLLALACLSFQLSALRVGMDQLNQVWTAAVGAATPARPDPLRWRVFGWIGATSWTAALALGVPLVTNAWNPDSTSLIFALVIILIPAVQCTGAAVVGPILTHTIQERETALEARLRIRAAADAVHFTPRQVRHHGLR